LTKRIRLVCVSITDHQPVVQGGRAAAGGDVGEEGAGGVERVRSAAGEAKQESKPAGGVESKADTAAAPARRKEKAVRPKVELRAVEAKADKLKVKAKPEPTAEATVAGAEAKEEAKAARAARAARAADGADAGARRRNAELRRKRDAEIVAARGRVQVRHPAALWVSLATEYARLSRGGEGHGVQEARDTAAAEAAAEAAKQQRLEERMKRKTDALLRGDTGVSPSASKPWRVPPPELPGELEALVRP
jgi:colicin import membrane protein